jgi:methanesulfonate monooxygenase subunit alpha
MRALRRGKLTPYGAADTLFSAALIITLGQVAAMASSAFEWETPPALPVTHYIDNRIYTDETIFEEEQQKIFAKVWKFCCHESELAEPGDFRTTIIAGKPIVIVRGEDGTVRAFYNACPHRGAPIVREPAGNEKYFTCLFHHWTFDSQGACIGITRPEAYEHCGLETGNCDLRNVRTELRGGLVFCNLDDDAPSFDDQFGDAFSPVADVIGQQPLEVFHYHRAVLPTNWKLWIATNTEVYHAYLHVVNRRTSMQSPGYLDRTTTLFPGGHSAFAPIGIDYDKYKQGDSQWSLRDLTLPGMQPSEFRVANYFPDLMINIRASTLRLDSVVPLSAMEVMVEFRGLGVKGESDENRRTRVNNHNQVWGPFGRNLPEDSIASVVQMKAMRTGASPYSIIARNEEGAPAMTDEPIRAYFQEWSRLMERPIHNPFGEP